MGNKVIQGPAHPEHGGFRPVNHPERMAMVAGVVQTLGINEKERAIRDLGVSPNVLGGRAIRIAQRSNFGLPPRG